MSRFKFPLWLLTILVVGLGIYFHTKSLAAVLGLNRLAISSVRSLMHEELPSDDLLLSVSDFGGTNCRVHWFAALLAVSTLNEKEELAEIGAAINCSADYIPMAWALAPESLNTALLATKVYPSNGHGWFWLAELSGESEPEQTIRYLNLGLSYLPSYARGWIQLGRLLEKENPKAATQAFLQACLLGDPGKHGCYNAGRITEQLGNFSKAIEYYRLSTFDLAIENAERLEAELNAK